MSGIAWLVLAVAVPAADLQIAHVTIVSPERTSEMHDALVRVHDGRIVEISKANRAPARSSANAIDGSGLFLSPGLIDSHVHLGGVAGMSSAQVEEHPDLAAAARAQIPHSYLLHGFTTLVDLVSTPTSMATWKSRGDSVPDAYYCGGAALMDGYPMNFDPRPQRYRDFPYMLIEPGMKAPEGIDPAMHTPQAVVARMKRDGAICVKAFFENDFEGVPVPKVETIRQLVRAAHAGGLPVLLHANSDEAQTFGLDAGVDIIAHGMWRWDHQDPNTVDLTPRIRQILDRVLAGNVGWQPTLQVVYGARDEFDPSFLSDPQLRRVLPSSLIDWYRSPSGVRFHEDIRKELEKEIKLPASADPAKLRRAIDERMNLFIGRAKQSAAYLIAHHGRILFGTDTSSAPIYANPPGLNAELEMHRLLEAGESPTQIFKSATLVNAQVLKLDRDIGTVQVGKRANLLLLRRDPMQTIDAYAGIVKVILNGRVLDPSELVANPAH